VRNEEQVFGVTKYHADFSSYFPELMLTERQRSLQGCIFPIHEWDVRLKEKLRTFLKKNHSRHRTYLQIARLCKHDINGRKLFQPGNFQGILVSYGWEANPLVWIIEYERCEKPKES